MGARGGVKKCGGGVKKKNRRERLLLMDDQFNDALCRLVRDINVASGVDDCVSLCQEAFGVWTIMGLDGCEFVEIRLGGLAKFEVEVILRFACHLLCSVRRDKTVYENIVSAFESIALRRARDLTRTH